MREVSGGEKQRLQQISGPLRHKDDKGEREKGVELDGNQRLHNTKGGRAHFSCPLEYAKSQK